MTEGVTNYISHVQIKTSKINKWKFLSVHVMFLIKTNCNQTGCTEAKSINELLEIEGRLEENLKLNAIGTSADKCENIYGC